MLPIAEVTQVSKRLEGRRARTVCSRFLITYEYSQNA